jgi:hypothetical protein
MSQTYNFDIATQTANGQVNPDIMAQQLLDAAYASGGAFEGLSIDGGTDGGMGVTVGGTMTVQWENPLDPADEAAQTALVAAHQGDAFGANVQRASSEPESSTTDTAPQTKVSATADPLPAGKYLIAAYCEIKLSAAVANSGVRARVVLDGNEVGEDNWGEDQWHAFSGAGVVDVKAGETPMMSITYERIGVLNTVAIRRARISISQQSA